MLPQLSQFEFHHRIEATRGVTLAVFTSPGCGGCRHIKQVLADVQQRRSEWQLFEVDAQTEPGLVNEFEVFHLPTLFLFHEGEFHCQLMAEAHPEAIIRAVAAALQLPASEAP